MNPGKPHLRHQKAFEPELSQNLFKFCAEALTKRDLPDEHAAGVAFDHFPAVLGKTHVPAAVGEIVKLERKLADQVERLVPAGEPEANDRLAGVGVRREAVARLVAGVCDLSGFYIDRCQYAAVAQSAVDLAAVRADVQNGTEYFTLSPLRSVGMRKVLKQLG